MAKGKSIYSVVLVMSTQKLPIVSEFLRVNPLIKAKRAAIPTDAERKFCKCHSQHLGQVAHCTFTSIGLPVGVCCKGNCSI